MMFKPKIIGFICNWSLPTMVDIASSKRMRGYPKIRIVRVECIGKIDATIILETLVKGADGVLVIGCPPPDCHYISGNYKAQNRILMLKKVLEQLGLESERLRLEWVYPYEIERFAMIIKDMTEEIKKLGPSPLRNACIY